MLSIKVDEEKILVGKIISGDREMEENVLRKLWTSSDDLYLSWSVLQLPNKIIFLRVLLKVFIIKDRYNCY